MKMSFGANYLEATTAHRRMNNSWTIKKIRSGWLVRQVKGGRMHEVYPNELRARYAASVLNGWVNEVFNIGSDYFSKQ